MPPIDPAVAGYLSGLPKGRREALMRLCALIRQQRPDLQETLRGQMPTYVDEQGPVLAVTSQKRGMSLYVDPALLRSYRRELARLHLGHNCIRFRSLGELPKDVIRAIIAEAGRIGDL